MKVEFIFKDSFFLSMLFIPPFIGKINLIRKQPTQRKADCQQNSGKRVIIEMIIKIMITDRIIVDNIAGNCYPCSNKKPEQYFFKLQGF